MPSVRHLALIVDGRGAPAHDLARALAANGLRNGVAPGMRAALALLAQWRFDAIVVVAASLDVPVDAALARLQAAGRATIVVVAAAGEGTQLAWLRGGASDVVAPGVSPALLAAKLRRLAGARHAVRDDDDGPREGVVVGPLRLDPQRAEASVHGRAMRLTALQFELLWMLARQPRRCIDREVLHPALTGRGLPESRCIDVHIYRLRKRLRELGADDVRIDTLHGRGYCLSIEPGQPARQEAA